MCIPLFLGAISGTLSGLDYKNRFSLGGLNCEFIAFFTLWCLGRYSEKACFKKAGLSPEVNQPRGHPLFFRDSLKRSTKGPS